ncbi:restriction endonuclease subunit S [Falsiroseomonas bella]|uniref:Restriction endonuclease subunit S n=1 Tax=Falsiroseomonas bella TaxID=2184016 RepID=A0A317F6W3_9PROT|nr:restriction endonuclease subunit S [Falsiroseomonas bella]PWS34764.1 restriction endonuclease subunit S [Falsiroseomonas bella]
MTVTGGRNATLAVIPGRFALSVGRPDLAAPSGWNWTRLADVARLESGHTPSRSRPEYWGGDVPWIGIRDATANHGRTLHDTNEHTNALGIANSSARILPAGTVCLSRTASVGYVVMMGRPMATSQDFVNWVCGDSLNPHFLKYVLLAEREALHVFATGSVHQTIYFPEAKAFHICLPPRPEQDAIVDVLGALDDKIELNRRMNETLEAMARAIFQDWFVAFGPTRAKMEGRPPYLAPDLWSLFPDRLDAEGKPEGWDTASVYDFADVIYGAPFASSRFNGEGRGLPLIRIRDLAEHAPSIFTDEEHPKAQIIEPGDIVIGMDGEFRLHQWKGPRALLNQRVCHLRPKPRVPRAFVAYALIEPLAFFERGKVGTTVIHLGKADIDTIRLISPGRAVLDGFGAAVEPLLARVVANAAEYRTLAATRDLLLPRLMSGELRVKDDERTVEAAA